MTLPSGTVTFLFTDIEGSTRLWDNFPDDMRRALAIHDDLVTGSVEHHGGVVIKNTGDGMFAAFDSPLEAVSAAIAASTSLHQADWPGVVGALGVRMALHTATIEPRDGHPIDLRSVVVAIPGLDDSSGPAAVGRYAQDPIGRDK